MCRGCAAAWTGPPSAWPASAAPPAWSTPPLPSSPSPAPRSGPPSPSAARSWLPSGAVHCSPVCSARFLGQVTRARQVRYSWQLRRRPLRLAVLRTLQQLPACRAVQDQSSLVANLAHKHSLKPFLLSIPIDMVEQLLSPRP